MDISAINDKTLCAVLSKMLNAEVTGAEHTASGLHGGTLGDVRLIEGTAETAGGKLPYKVVLKTQKKWERPADPRSWRREYDLYMSGLGAVLPEHFRWPECYHAELNGDQIQIWMEYACGVSGGELTLEMLEQAAFELGRFQGKLFSLPELITDLSNFGGTGYLRGDYEQWHTQMYGYEQLISGDCPLPGSVKQALKSGAIELTGGKSFEFSYLRSGECAIPRHLKQMIIDIDDNLDALFNGISKLPVVLCHRDFWIENIIWSDGSIRLIDWDTAGWGYLGEDLASLIADDIDFGNFEEYCRKLIPAYYKGISEHMDISNTGDRFIREMILLKFGYRFVQSYMYAEDAAEREEAVTALQKIAAQAPGVCQRLRG
jgi:thiamine kinase-like enzyme